MSDYRRFRIEGATYFFTLTLAHRGHRTLVDHIDLLRGAFARTRSERPFHCEAMVVLPDHLHAVWTLPPGDCDFATRWGAIKSRFVMGLREADAVVPTDLPVVDSGRYAGLNARPTQLQARSGHLAAAVLGALHSRRGGLPQPCGVLLGQSGQARVCRASGGLAAFVDPSRCAVGTG